MSKLYTIHIDVDSPPTLAKFYQLELNSYDISKLETFYEVTFQRIIELFKPYHIKATFFCVASEVECSERIQKVIQNAIAQGHFIGHHTLNHPFGLNEMSDIEIQDEIEKANAIFIKTIGKIPEGFRAPGYAIDTKVINVLEKNGLLYDSSSAWPLFHVIFKLIRRFKQSKETMLVGFGETNSKWRTKMYIPSKNNWKSTSKTPRNFKEYPLPASFWLIPCYGNLHLYFRPWLTKFLLTFTNRFNHLIYLMHSIEFASLEDDFIPKEIVVHPHVKTNNAIKQFKIKSTLKALNKKRKQFVIEENI